MGGNNFYRLDEEEKRLIFEAVANKLGIPPSAVEKDWWVVQTLTLIQEMSVAPHIIFKGGTSLSKAWHIIERFSEDIDLALDKKILGIESCSTTKQVKKLRSVTRKYINENFILELRQKCEASGFVDVDIALDESEGKNLEPVQILLSYATVTELSSYNKPVVKIEIGSRSLQEPSTLRSFSTLVGEFFAGRNFADKPIEVSCVNPERTLIEKLFLLHEEFQKTPEIIRVERLSRHLYDVEMLTRAGYADIALSDQKLYNEIIEHRRIYTKISAVDYELHQPKTLNPLPPQEIIALWKKDYETMQEEMIYGDSLSFEELYERVKVLTRRINTITWTH